MTTATIIGGTDLRPTLVNKVREHLVGEEIEAFAVQHRVDRVLGDAVLSERGRGAQQVALPRRQS
jgi:hypothetical protein